MFSLVKAYMIYSSLNNSNVRYLKLRPFFCETLHFTGSKRRRFSVLDSRFWIAVICFQYMLFICNFARNVMAHLYISVISCLRRGYISLRTQTYFRLSLVSAEIWQYLTQTQQPSSAFAFINFRAKSLNNFELFISRLELQMK